MKVIKPLGRGRNPDQLRISLCDLDHEIARVLAEHFHDVDGVEVLVGDLLDLDCDALVSPANSFGDMSGGIDQRIDRFHEGSAQRALQGRIAAKYHGELPVGVATVIEMGTRRFPYLVAAPTMRVPGRVSGTTNAYLAMRAVFTAILDHNASEARRIRSVAVPGLCTGVGGMAAAEAAPQMRAAYDMVVLGGWRRIEHPAQAPFALGSGPAPWQWGSGGGR
ncbi:macro domain-containing protein [Paludisphaera sp.]|uniref:macro domain-containing protein n=1 Tax=Paludisphaera sp. TaxID=2017432 RepID=UPI00301D07F7